MHRPDASARREENEKLLRGVGFEMMIHAHQACSIFELCVLIMNAGGQRVGLADLRTGAGVYTLRAGQDLVLRVELNRLALIPGTYDLGFFIRTDRHMRDYPALQVLDILPRTTRQNWASYGAEYLGHVALETNVSVELAPSAHA